MAEDDDEDRDFEAEVERFMEDNIEQFEEPDPESLDDFKPIFMIGPCRLEAEEADRRQKQNRIMVFDKEKPATGLERIEEVSGDSAVLNQDLFNKNTDVAAPTLQDGPQRYHADLTTPQSSLLRPDEQHSRARSRSRSRSVNS